jgi:hypothetical protein
MTPTSPHDPETDSLRVDDLGRSRARRMAAGLPARKSDAALRRERKAEARPAKRATQRD